MRPFVALGLVLAAAGMARAPLDAQTADSQFTHAVDSIAQQVLQSTGVPSASVAVVQRGKVVYAQAYGAAQLEPRTPARPEMRYSIGSISKQFAAASILLLQQEGKLSLDDPVARYLPDLTRAGEVTIRQLLSHTSGYQDYWPQDYVPPFMLDSIGSQKILDIWAKKPLDFDPGTRWQYSNTNYVIAGLIVEKASGMPFIEFLKTRIFMPLGMRSVLNIDQGRLTQSDPVGYMRYALGPLHPAPKEGKGWLFAAGELAMTASDLAKWDIAMMDQSLLSPASYRVMETETLLKNGTGTGYGLGVDVGMDGEHRVISHGGEVSGFTSENRVYPDDRAAVVVLTSQDAASASGAIARQIGDVLFSHRRRQHARPGDAGASHFRGAATRDHRPVPLLAQRQCLFQRGGRGRFRDELGWLGISQGLLPGGAAVARRHAAPGVPRGLRRPHPPGLDLRALRWKTRAVPGLHELA